MFHHKLTRQWKENTTRFSMYKNGVQELYSTFTVDDLKALVECVTEYEEDVVDTEVLTYCVIGEGCITFDAGDCIYKIGEE